MHAVSSPEARIVAVLHDVCEDCPGWTFDRLRAESFPEPILAALDAVTKRQGEAYDAFVQRAATDPIGREMKIVDLRDDCDLSRIAAEPRDFERLARDRSALDVIAGPEQS